jgi:hypothetical protein
MQFFTSRTSILIFGLAVCLLTTQSLNWLIWIEALAALVIALLGLQRTREHKVLIWIVSYSWIMIAADIWIADLDGRAMASAASSTNAALAVELSLCALIALAFGMNAGCALVRHRLRLARQHEWGAPLDYARVDMHRLGLLYFSCYFINYSANLLGGYISALQQPLYALAGLKFVCVYISGSTAFKYGRGYGWLLAIVVLEILIGITSYFASYKEAIFILLIAMVSGPIKRGGLVFLVGAGAVLFLIYYSLVWTAIKSEYRARIDVLPTIEKLEWILGRIQSGDIDYGDAAQRLMSRVGYTDYYALTLDRIEARSIVAPDSLYGSAILRVVTPRILFPEKAAINDSTLTTMLTGIQFNQTTSASVGYVAEAHVDFGIPWMFVPIALIGALLGSTAEYFMSRRGSLVIKQAFATACLFNCFVYGTNIDKALGGFIITFIVLALTMNVFGKALHRWLYSSAFDALTRGGVVKVSER